MLVDINNNDGSNLGTQPSDSGDGICNELQQQAAKPVQYTLEIYNTRLFLTKVVIGL